MSHYNLEKTYDALREGTFDNIGVNLIRVIPNSKNVLALILAPFKNKQYWDANKNYLVESFINEFSKHLIPAYQSMSYIKKRRLPTHCTDTP